MYLCTKEKRAITLSIARQKGSHKVVKNCYIIATLQLD